MAYAATTKVPVSRTKAQIEDMLNKYGADEVAMRRAGNEQTIGFMINGVYVVFQMQEPDDAQATRAIWRAMMMTIKMKLESVENGIETFEQAFLAHIMAPDGRRYGDHIIPVIASNYKDRTIPRLPNF